MHLWSHSLTIWSVPVRSACSESLWPWHSFSSRLRTILHAHQEQGMILTTYQLEYHPLLCSCSVISNPSLLQVLDAIKATVNYWTVGLLDLPDMFLDQDRVVTQPIDRCALSALLVCNLRMNIHKPAYLFNNTAINKVARCKLWNDTYIKVFPCEIPM